MKISEDINLSKDNPKEIPKNLEEIFLICCLKDKEYLKLIRSELKETYFQDKHYQIIFNKILNLDDEKILSFEALFLSFKNENLKPTEKKKILNKVLELNQDIVINKKLLQFYLTEHLKSYEFNKFENDFRSFLANLNVSNYENELLKLLSRIQENKKIFKSDKFVKISKVISKLIESFNDKNKTTFLPSGFKDLDNLINGFYPGELIIIAGVTSIGKTSFSLALLWNIAKTLKEDEECIYCSFEMTNEQLLTRIAASELSIELSRINMKNFSDFEGQKFFYFEEYMKKNDRISFTSNSDYNLKEADDLYYEIKKRASGNFKICALFVDYLQLMSSKNIKNKHEEISYITKVLKKIALEFNIPVIALSQFSRGVHSDKNSRPKLFHLKESGSIEQDADLVILLHKDHEKDNENENGMISNDPTEVELIVAKNRNGRIGTVKLRFMKNFCKFISDEKPAN
ncbi:AAA family ATPase [symbiont of Argiope bruennichi]|uniref:DnaB-like helicase C-terminal domain-containing protein n=1 Tax=symbiont of Argiope bruennichi TaxID=2810479 RepID=UPI003DA52EB6